MRICCSIHHPFVLLDWIIPAVIILALSGCVNWRPPSTALPISDGIKIPNEWTTAQAAGAGAYAVTGDSLVAWWQRFDDPLMTELVRRSLTFNATIAKARAALAQAQALRDVSGAALLPTLGASVSAQRGTAGGDSTGNRLELGVDGQWVPDVFGARRNALEASNALLSANAATLGDIQVQVAAEVALNYILLRSAQARWTIANNNLTSQQETLQITDWRQQAGLVTMLEVESARASTGQTQASLPLLQISVEQAAHALAVLVGQPPGALHVALGVLPTSVPPQGLSAKVPQARMMTGLNIPAETLRQRADVQANEYQVAAALSRVGQAQAQRWPSFAIGGSLGLSAVSVAALIKGASVLSSLLGSVTLPLFDGGAARANVRVQQAASEQAQQTYRTVVFNALKDVENALVALRADQERLVSLQIAADAASNAALLARLRYASGLVDFQTVLQTQRTQLATQDGVASASADIGSDQVRLFTALGGGWRMPDALPVPAR
jgi:outer membrane protein, multidrug efflux system